MDEPSKSLFWEACGTPGPLRLRVDGDVEGVGSWSLPQPFALIGRDTRADIPLPDEHVSKRHAYLQVIAGRVFYADLGSRTGIRSEGTLRVAGWMDRTRPIEIGPYTFRFDESGSAFSGGAEDPAHLPHLADPWLAGPDDLPAVSLEAINVKSRPSWRLDRVMTLVGSAPGCQLTFSNHELSRFHCSLLRTPLGVWAIDLIGRERIEVNGKEVSFARLEEGDDLRVGPIWFRVRYVSTIGLPSFLGSHPRTGVLAPRPARYFPLPQLPASAMAGESLPAQWIEPAQEPSPILVERSAEPLFELMMQRFDGMQHQMVSVQQQMSDQLHQTMIAMFQMFGVLHRDQMGIVHKELDQIRQITDELKALQTEAQRPTAKEQKEPATPTAPSVEPSGLVHPEPSTKQHREDRPLTPAGAPSRDPSSGSVDEHIHDMLSRRIVELQRERQSRWQRVMGLVVGQ